MSKLLVLLVNLVYCLCAHRELTPLERKWKEDHNPMELLSIEEQIEINSKQIKDFRANVAGALFSGVFTDNAVLQRQPYHASLYGVADTGSTPITLTMTDEDTKKISKYNANSMKNGDWKIGLPLTYKNGGNYTFKVSCAGCKSSVSDTIVNVTFGDVFFCAGQSNMQLELHFTFSRNYTYDNITKLGKYSNIRFFTSADGNRANETFVIPVNNGKGGEYRWNQVNSTTIHLLDLFSAACFYTAQFLTDNHAMSDVNFGLIDTAVGGTIVEAWTKNHTIDKYCVANTTACPGPGCGGLYNGMVMPWINMTIKTALWYQGENNVGRQAAGKYGGNILNHTGYACMEQLMLQQWRTNWTLVNGGEIVPFGLVTLASGTSEGNQPSMGPFRWNQMLNYDILPPPGNQVPKTFVVQGHDIGDPWYSGCKECLDATAPYTANNSLGNGTAWMMGPVHPRPKIFLGERMAIVVAKFVYGVDQIYSGPLLSGCYIDDNSKTLTIQFNKTMMYDEKLFYQPFDAWYNKSLTVEYQNAIMLNNNSKWEPIDDKLVSVDTNGNSVSLDISSFYNNQAKMISGIRYAWSDNPCCGNLNQKNNPCPPVMCPFQTSKTRLPAIPFWAQIVNNKCKCFAPQTC
eukprot:159117_1